MFKKNLVIFAILFFLVGCQNQNLSNTDKIDNSDLENADKIEEDKEVIDDNILEYKLVFNEIEVDLNSTITFKEISNISKENLSILRNAIFAKYGYVFSTSKYDIFFRKQSWYEPDETITDINVLLNENDRLNIDLILKIEKNFNVLSNNLTTVEQSLVGLWHDSPYVAAGYGELYTFNSDRTYSFHFSQYIGDNRIRAYMGKWFILDNKLYLQPIQEEYYQGGKLVKASPSMVSENELTGGKLIIQDVTDISIDELALDFNIKTDKHEPLAVKFGDKIFYYLSADSEEEVKEEVKEKINEEEIIIQDIESYNHPTKEALEYRGYKLLKIELKNKTYPIYYVEHDQLHDIYSYNLIKEIAEKNAFWDFKIVDDNGFIEVQCDRKTKSILKTKTDKGVTDYTIYNFSKYEGEWYDTSFINVNDGVNMIKLHFLEDNKSAMITLVSSSEEKGLAEIKTETKFDYFGKGIFSFNDDLWGNKGRGEICISEDTVSIKVEEIEKTNSEKGFSLGFGNYVTKKDYNGIKKAMNILHKDYDYEDNHKGSYIPKTDDNDSVYFAYEGIDEQGRYIIGVRKCKDTVIVAWYYFEPDTLEVEVEEM
ncbi:YARHG domain-containing protein [Vallitalea sp.]|uniref:YARHG domain-containing protein n=1 Tax=Vallitalea sp. TaxID=1882829 RepID=UPI0025CF9FBA|nr:YARHG domain-containing protein [Vallitalea sp.]MCT4687598.1 YARHG domain-containing protein [Vallitalea sp.]